MNNGCEVEMTNQEAAYKRVTLTIETELKRIASLEEREARLDALSTLEDIIYRWNADITDAVKNMPEYAFVGPFIENFKIRAQSIRDM